MSAADEISAWTEWCAFKGDCEKCGEFREVCTVADQLRLEFESRIELHQWCRECYESNGMDL